jgi:carbon monoxide dehydrogenase subunit G
MKIEDTFRVDVPIDEAWRVLLDLERIAPCMPGAELQEVEGDEYRGVVKVKVGPITAQYKGVARLAEVDEANRRAVIDAQGRDTRGQGNAKAAITISLTELSGGATEVSVDNDVTITGKVAQFGRGVMADVSSKLLAQFVECLEANVLGCPPVGAEAEAAVAPAPVEPVDLLRTAGAPVLKRVLPAIAVVGVVVVVVLVLLLR